MTQVQDEFVSRFKAYMASAAAYKPLADFIKAHPEKEIRDCLTIYFGAAKDYDTNDDRSRKTFYDLSARLLTDADVYFALHYEVLVHLNGTPWQKHYNALDSTTQNRVGVLIKRKKTALTSAQRAFIQVFDDYTSRPDPKKLEKFLYRYKFQALSDCLLAYIEVSQRLPDSDKNSLTIFFALSFRALGLGDSYFAAHYESLVHSEGTVWKRRYDALEAWQRTDKLEPAVKEKQVVRTADYRGSPLTVKHVIPNTAPGEAPTPDDQRPAPGATAIQRQFVQKFKEFMASHDRKAAKTTISDYIMARSPQELKEIVEAYLQASRQYDDHDERSLYVFFGAASLAVAKGEAYYAFKFKTQIKSAGSLIARRYAALNDWQKKELSKEIAKRGKRPRLTDDLKTAYFQKNHKDADPQALRLFEVQISEELALMLSKILDSCGYAFSKPNVADFREAFELLTDFLGGQKDIMVLYGMLQHCKKAPGLALILRHQLYWYMTGALYVQALIQRPEVYKRGLSDEERALLFDAADRKDPYFSDFALRLDYLWLRYQSHAQFSELSKAYAILLLFAQRFAMRLVPLEAAAAVQGLTELLKKYNWDYLYNIKIPVSSRYSPGKTLGIGQTWGKVYIVWWDPKAQGEAYVEIDGFEGILFAAESYRRLGQVYDDDAIYGEIYRQTKDLLVLMEVYFTFMGYLPDLVSGGLSGLVEAVIINYAMEETAEALGVNSTAFQLVVMGAGLMAHYVGSELKGGPPGGTSAESAALEGRATSGSLGETGGADRNLADRMLIDESAGGAPKGTLAEVDMRGVRTQEGEILIRGEEPSSSEVPPRVKEQAIDSPLVNADGVGNRGTGSTSTPQAAPPPATRNDLHQAEEHLTAARGKLERSVSELETKKNRVGDIEAKLEDVKTEKAKGNLQKELDGAKRAEASARADYKSQKYELRAAESRVERLRSDLASRGELDESLGNRWNLPDNPVKFRRGTVEADSWSSAAFVGTNDNRTVWERFLQEDPNGELSQRLLDPNSNPIPSKRTLYRAKGKGLDIPYWKQHPEVIELAHVLSKHEGGREVIIVMTKARNQTFGALHEHTGGIFLEEAVVIQGIAVDRQSAVDMGIPSSVINNAPVIKFPQ